MAEEEEEAWMLDRDVTDDDAALEASSESSSSESSLQKYGRGKIGERGKRREGQADGRKAKGQSADGESERAAELTCDRRATGAEGKKDWSVHAEKDSLCYSGSGDFSPRRRLLVPKEARGKEGMEGAGESEGEASTEADEYSEHGDGGDDNEEDDTELDSLDDEVLSEIERGHKGESASRPSAQSVKRQDVFVSGNASLSPGRTTKEPSLSETRGASGVRERPGVARSRPQPSESGADVRQRVDATGLFPKGVPWGTKIEMLRLAKQDAWHRGATRFSRLMFQWEKDIGLR